MRANVRVATSIARVLSISLTVCVHHSARIHESWLQDGTNATMNVVNANGAGSDAAGSSPCLGPAPHYARLAARATAFPRTLAAHVASLPRVFSIMAGPTEFPAEVEEAKSLICDL
jgi:hypothetical protein